MVWTKEIIILVETATRLWVSVSDGSGVLFERGERTQLGATYGSELERMEQ